MSNSNQKDTTQKGGDQARRPNEAGQQNQGDKQNPGSQQNQGGQRSQPGQQVQGHPESGSGKQTGGQDRDQNHMNRKEGSK
jgi:hypothetical protein